MRLFFVIFIFAAKQKFYLKKQTIYCLQVTDRFGKSIQNQLQSLYRNVTSQAILSTNGISKK